MAGAFGPFSNPFSGTIGGVWSVFLGILKPEQMSPSQSQSRAQVLQKDLEAASAVPLTLMRHYFSLYFKLLGGVPPGLNGPPSSLYSSHII